MSRPSGRSGGLMPNVADAVAEAAAEMVAEESADRRRAEEAVSAAAAAVGGAQLAGSGLGVGHHGFTRDFGYHHEYQGAAGPAAPYGKGDRRDDDLCWVCHLGLGKPPCAAQGHDQYFGCLA